MREAHVPGTFERLDQGSRATTAQVEAFRRAQEGLTQEGLVVIGETRGGLRVPRAVLPAFLIISLALSACGPGSGGEVQPPAAVAPAQAQELSSPTAVPTEAKPTVAPTESPKPTATIEKVTEDKIGEVVGSLKTSFQNLDPCQTFPQSCQGRELILIQEKKELADMIQKAEDGYRSGNMETFRQELLNLKKWMHVQDFSGPPEDLRFLKLVEPETAKKHDPLDKYVQNDKISLVLRPAYWQVIDLLVGTDSSYSK